jgi:septum formation protein
MKGEPDEAVDLVLASGSPRRRQLLEQLGLALLVAPSDVDETPKPGERAADYARRIAAEKCATVADARAAAQPPSPLAVLAADTIVVLDGEILGKPADEAAARAMLGRLAGRRHQVITATAIRLAGELVERAVTTTVTMRSLDAIEIDAYIGSGEWRGKAGGYAIQGIAGAFVSEVRGSHTNVIGLPLAEVLADLRALRALPRYPRSGFGVQFSRDP